MERSRLIAAVIFIVTVAAIVVISSAGVSTLNAPVSVNEVATSRITALVPFTYQSAERTRAAREYLAALDESRTPPKSVSLTDPQARWTFAPGGPPSLPTRPTT